MLYDRLMLPLLSILVVSAGWIELVGSQPLTSPPPDGQVIKDSGGGVFMEEVMPDKPKPKPGRRSNNANPYNLPGAGPRGRDMQIDLSGVGVKVDPRGNIIPLINRDTPGDIQPLYSRTTVTQEMPYPYFVGPAGGVGWGPATFRPTYYPGYSPGYSPGYWPGWNYPYAQPWSNMAPPAYRYVSPQGVSPWVSPYGAFPYSGGMFTNPFANSFNNPGLSAGFRLGNGNTRGFLWLPNTTQYQYSSSVRPLFPAAGP